MSEPLAPARSSRALLAAFAFALGTAPAVAFFAAMADRARSTSSSPATRSRSTGPSRRALSGTSTNRSSMDFAPMAASIAVRSSGVRGR